MHTPHGADARRVIAAAIAGLTLFAVACTSEPDDGVDQVAWCTDLRSVTGPTGAEALDVNDPERLGQTTRDLRRLADPAPADIADAVGELATVFEEVQRLPRDQKTNFLADREEQLALRSQELTNYARDTCRVLLQRAPATPTPIPDRLDVTE